MSPLLLLLLLMLLQLGAASSRARCFASPATKSRVPPPLRLCS